jgi:hypothetical protein
VRTAGVPDDDDGCLVSSFDDSMISLSIVVVRDSILNRVGREVQKWVDYRSSSGENPNDNAVISLIVTLFMSFTFDEN